MRKLSLLLLIPLLGIAACKKEKETHIPDPPPGGGGPVACNATYLPVVMCHGMLASGDTYALQAQRLVQNGYCADRIFVLDWNTLGVGSSVADLDALIDDVLQQTGASRVELMGHSAGGGLGYDYLSDADRAAKVANYVHIGSGAQPGLAGPNGEVPTLNIWSAYDAVVAGANIPGAENVELADKDHYEVATSPETFTAFYSFFRGQGPASTNIVADGSRNVSGRVLTLGENASMSDASIRVFEVDPATGSRTTVDPVHGFTADANGRWGPFSAGQGTYYEFEVTPADGGRRVHYYREPFITSDRFVYLRTLPPATSLAGIVLSSLPNSDDQAVVVSFTANQAVIAGRDDLRVNGLELSTTEFASEDDSAIAFFLYDDGDGQTSGSPVGLFGSFPFLSGVDVFFPTTEPQTIEMTFAGRAIRMRNWPSASEGITIAVFN